MLINSVDPGSPAGRRGPAQRHILLPSTDRGGRAVSGAAAAPIQNMIASLPVGSTVKLSVKTRAQAMGSAGGHRKTGKPHGRGVGVDKWWAQRAQGSGPTRGRPAGRRHGVIVIGVQPRFPAALRSRLGDVITRVDQQPLKALLMISKRIYQAFDAKPSSLLLSTTRDRPRIPLRSEA